MRVLFWSETFWPHTGGIEIFSRRLLSDLREKGHEFLVITSQRSPDRPELFELDGISVYRFPFRRMYASKNHLIEGFVHIKQQVIQLKRSFAPDLIHINEVGVSHFFHAITADAYRAPVLATLNGGWTKENNTLLAQVLITADWVVGFSAFTLGKGRQLVPDIITRSSFIHNGLSVPKLFPEPLPMKRPYVLCLGRLCPEMGFDVAVTAFAFLVKSCPQARLLIVGDGSEKIKLERQIVECGLTNKVELAGEISPKKIPSLLNKAAIVMIPSRLESFELVALEAALMARPVVATRVGGIPEVVVHNETGLIVEPEDPKALANAIYYLLTDKKTAQKMGLAARRRAQGIFSWQRCVDAYDALYRKLTSRSDAGNSKAVISSRGNGPYISLSKRKMNIINRSRFGTTWINDGFDGKIAFKNMQLTFQGALAKYPDEVFEDYFKFAGRSTRIRIVGSELAEHICRSFSHLRTNDRCTGTPTLTIDFWDERKTNKSLPVENEIWTERTVKSSDDRFVGQQLPNTFSCLDRYTGHILSSITWNDHIFIYERAKPLARPLLEWHKDQNVQVIHAGLVARYGQGVLLSGKSGSGKSTCSLLCICSGFQYLSDDYVGLQRLDDGSFAGHSLYNSVFLETAHLERFTELVSYAIKGRPPQEEKSVIILSQVFPERLERVVPIRALALPVVTKTPKPRIRPASKGEALLTLGPSSILQIPNRELGARGFEMMAQLIERIPCYWLELGRETESVPALVNEILAKTVRF